MKKAFFLFPLLILYFTTIQAQIAHHQWKDRILLLFTELPKDSLLLQQITHFEEDKKGLNDRDLVIYQIYENKGIAPNGRQLNVKDVKQLRGEYKVSDGLFTIILIGKDGGEKLQKTNELLTRQLLYSTIDAMPMRRAEMRRKKKN